MPYLSVVFLGKVPHSRMTAPDLSYLGVLRHRNGWRANMKYGLGTHDYSSRTCWEIVTSMVRSITHHIGNTMMGEFAGMKILCLVIGLGNKQ
jgi:hypothetical protein